MKKLLVVAIMVLMLSGCGATFQTGGKTLSVKDYRVQVFDSYTKLMSSINADDRMSWGQANQELWSLGFEKEGNSSWQYVGIPKIEKVLKMSDGELSLWMKSR